jgi:DNA-binding MarR family transcriptional regulator
MVTTQLRLVFDIHRVTHRIGLFIQRHAPDLTQAEAHILCHLLEFGDSTIGEVHRAFAHKRSTLTSVLDRMVARGLVTRESSPKDRRSFVVSLTRSGQNKAAKIHLHLQAMETDALRGSDVRTLESFRHVMGRLESIAAGE